MRIGGECGLVCVCVYARVRDQVVNGLAGIGARGKVGGKFYLVTIFKLREVID